jgi:hypothetical protein
VAMDYLNTVSIEIPDEWKNLIKIFEKE